MFTEKDLTQLASHGISPEVAGAQMRRFVTGFPYLRLSGSAAVGHGIHAFSPQEEDFAVSRWKQYLAEGGEVAKFVPASGAASRMFKALFAFVNGDETEAEEGSPVAKILYNLDKLAFIDELNDTAMRLYGMTAGDLLEAGRQKDIINAIISEEGMNYGNLPKALLTFHKYADGSVRTPLEEHLAEGAQTAATGGKVNLHFTVSANHHGLFEKKIAESVKPMEDRFGVKYDISISEQKPSTDTIAATLDNEPFRDGDGNLVFRPGGHGALIENLGDMDSAVVFIKNIDNVVPDSQRQATIDYKKVIAGYLVEVVDTIDKYLDMINTGRYTMDDVRDMIAFMHDTLNIRDEKMKSLEDVDLVLYIKNKLNRPVRVCGMVRNEGEPGGGPYITRNPDGSRSLQILESSQIDLSKEENKQMMAKATHFNPVDLVCYVRDYKGGKYDLPSYVDPETGFISSKSLHGRSLKALELPGLWNGAMSDWLTAFVEVPIATFNPVKTVNDLLRPVHAH